MPFINREVRKLVKLFRDWFNFWITNQAITLVFHIRSNARSSYGILGSTLIFRMWFWQFNAHISYTNYGSWGVFELRVILVHWIGPFDPVVLGGF
jgi:hypothetical protein